MDIWAEKLAKNSLWYLHQCIFIKNVIKQCLQSISDNCGTAAIMWFLSNTIVVALKTWEILGTITNHIAARLFRL